MTVVLIWTVVAGFVGWWFGVLIVRLMSRAIRTARVLDDEPPHAVDADQHQRDR